MIDPIKQGHKCEIGKIDQLTVSEDGQRLIGPMSNVKVDLPAEMRFFGEPMVGITVKQFDEYQALRARAAELCTWNHIPDAGDDDNLYETACEQEFQWLGSDTQSLKFCWNCGRKVEVKQ